MLAIIFHRFRSKMFMANANPENSFNSKNNYNESSLSLHTDY